MGYLQLRFEVAATKMVLEIGKEVVQYTPSNGPAHVTCRFSPAVVMATSKLVWAALSTGISIIFFSFCSVLYDTTYFFDEPRIETVSRDADLATINYGISRRKEIISADFCVCAHALDVSYVQIFYTRLMKLLFRVLKGCIDPKL